MKDRGASFFAGLWAGARRSALADRDRWPLGLPIALGMGIGFYFALPFEPHGAWAAWAVLMAGLLAWGLPAQTRLGVRLAMIAAAVALIGFAAAKLRTESVRAPVLTRPVGPVHLTARVIAAEPRGEGFRLLLAPEPLPWLSAGTPARVRLSARHADVAPPAGSFVRLTAQLMPPPGPAMPGDYDFARWAFFKRIGAVGYALGAPRPIPAPRALRLDEAVTAVVARLRDRMTARILAAVPGSDGAIAAALITGERANVAPADEDAYRDSGLTHVLSISGVHLALAGGIFFWAIRALLALIPAIALRYPIKKWAAVAALLGSTFYLVISGADPPAVRSQIMLAAMFVAILCDRPALTMRSVALAAGVILLIEPECLTDPGAQMSFASVIGLIALAETISARRAARYGLGVRPSRSLPARLVRYAAGIVAASLIAGLVSAPIAIYHFDRASQYGLISNLLAEPVVGTVIMPAATAAMVAMPFGGEGPPLWLMGKGVAAMTAIARWTAGLPGASALVPVWPLAGLLAVMGGFLWISLWRQRWRWLGVLPILLGAVGAFCGRGPDILVARDLGAVAVRLADGRLAFLRPPKDEYAASDWLKRAGDARRPMTAVAGVGDGVRCDGDGCLAHADDGTLVAYDLRVDALAEDCRRADIVVSAVPAWRFCGHPSHALVIDRIDIAQTGGVAVWLPSRRIETVAERRGDRPWSATVEK